MSEVIIDVKDALERVQDDKELLLELFDIFSEDFVGKSAQFWQSFEKQDIALFRQIAHGLKGATGNISARQMHNNCVELDRIGKDGNIKDVKSRLELLDQQFADFKVEAARLKREFGK